MKLVRSGGTNASLEKDEINYIKYDFGNYFMLQIKPDLNELVGQRKEISLCVAVKPNKHPYNQRLSDIGFNVDDFNILGRDDDAEWGQRDSNFLR